MPADTYAEIDPLLEPDALGVFRPQSGSPAIDSAAGNYPAVTLDMDGQPRTDPKDKGADEVSFERPSPAFRTPGEMLRLLFGRS